MVDAVDEDEAAFEGQFTAAARRAPLLLLTEGVATKIANESRESGRWSYVTSN